MQCVSYLPHFLSTVVVAALMMNGLQSNGIVNQVLGWFGHAPIIVPARPGLVPVDLRVLGDLAVRRLGDDPLPRRAHHHRHPALRGGRIDGAGRWRQTWHVTLPGIRPTMMVVLILNIGTFMAVGFEKILLIYNPLTYPTADVISTYLYRVGILSGNFSYAATIGLFESVIGLALVLGEPLLPSLVGAGLW